MSERRFCDQRRATCVLPMVLFTHLVLLESHLSLRIIALPLQQTHTLTYTNPGNIRKYELRWAMRDEI